LNGYICNVLLFDYILIFIIGRRAKDYYPKVVHWPIVSTETIETSETGDHPVLEVDGISKHFGDLKAVDDVSLAIPEGEVHAIIGPNGAGKTTMFNLITGSLRPTYGEVYFEGQDVTRESLDARTRMGMSRVFQSAEVFPQLSIKENVRLAAQSNNQSFNPFKSTLPEHEKQTKEILNELEFGESMSTKVSALSHGDKKRLEIGMGLATDPSCLLLDEPTSGVSQEDSERIIDQLVEMTEGITVILIEHDIEIVMDVSDRITVLDTGERIAQGPPTEIQDNEDVREAYLGGVA